MSREGEGGQAQQEVLSLKIWITAVYTFCFARCGNAACCCVNKVHADLAATTFSGASGAQRLLNKHHGFVIMGFDITTYVLGKRLGLGYFRTLPCWRVWKIVRYVDRVFL
jgi:hypothetical protein